MAITTDGKLKEGIHEKLSILTTRVKLETAVGHTDINHEAEDFYCGLLNAVFDWELSNLNALQMNFPAIDLADRKKRIAVQVTSTEDRKKVQDTLNRFFEKKLDKYFDRLIVLIIGKKPNSRGQFTLKGELDFEAKRDIWDTAALIRKIYALQEGKLKAVAEYIEKQLPEQNKLKVTLGEDSAVVTELRGIRKATQIMAENSNKQLMSLVGANNKENGALEPGTVRQRIKDTPTVVEEIIEPIIKAETSRGTGCISDDAFDGMILEALRKMVAIYETHDYFFNLAIDIFVERTAELIEDSLIRILGCEIPAQYNRYFRLEDFESLFCGYYALSLIYKKTNNLTKLRELSADKYKVFIREPLYHEVQSRILKRSDEPEDLRKALKEDSTAISYLKNYGVDNCAVGNSYASTVCMMLARKQKVDSEAVKNALDYIEAAISFNPEYPKYYFVKAQLLFYSNLRKKMELSQFTKICKEVKFLASTAETVLYKLYLGEAAHYDEEVKKYGYLCDAVDKELAKREKAAAPQKYKRIKEEEATAHKNKVLDSCGYESCEAPDKPVLSAEDEYIYVCFSPLDYKTVYCDLIELYRKKIPFLFDEKISAGAESNMKFVARINNSKCKGVVFYISNHSLVSPDFCDQIKMTYGRQKYLAVNLEGDCLPTKIAMDTVLSKCSKEKNEYPIKGTHLRSFILAFDDNHEYIAKHRVYGEKGTQHIPYLRKTIIGKFGLVI